VRKLDGQVEALERIGALIKQDLQKMLDTCEKRVVENANALEDASLAQNPATNKFPTSYQNPKTEVFAELKPWRMYYFLILPY